MGTHLIDSNAIIEFLGGTLPSPGSQWMQKLVANDEHHLSIINRIEVLSYNDSPSEMQVLMDFIDASDVLSLTEDVVLKTINLRQEIKIKLPDAIIAATALSNNLILVTRNTSDFKKVKGLTIVNPHLI